MTKQARRRIFKQSHRDDNEPSIIAILTRLGIPFVLMPPAAGFDLLVMTSPMQCWEVKNPEYKWTLTTAEHVRQKYCRAHGIPYHVVESIEQVVSLLGDER